MPLFYNYASKSYQKVPRCINLRVLVSRFCQPLWPLSNGTLLTMENFPWSVVCHWKKILLLYIKDCPSCCGHAQGWPWKMSLARKRTVNLFQNFTYFHEKDMCYIGKICYLCGAPWKTKMLIIIDTNSLRSEAYRFDLLRSLNIRWGA